MMNDITYAGLIFNAASIPCDLFLKLCDNYDPKEIFTGPDFLRELGLSDSHISRLSSILVKTEKNGWPERELEQLNEMGARFITAKDIDYPVKLADLKRPPVGLYVKGSLNLSLPSIAIVGTRKPSDYGRMIATSLARGLALRGITTISGGAKGIDSAAHRGSLQELGATVAVFGTSIDKVYPVEHRDLFSRITERGAVISEYPLKSPSEAWHFPERNRIIAALASRVVIVESRNDGGAMITADNAITIGRDLWAVPGRITDENSTGTNSLIYNGAKCLYNIEDFIDSFAGKHEQLNIFGDIQEELPPIELSDTEQVIYSLLQKQGNKLLDEIIAESGLDEDDIQDALMTLQAEGLVQESSGRFSASY